MSVPNGEEKRKLVTSEDPDEVSDSWEVAYVYAFIKRFVTALPCTAPYFIDEFENALQLPKDCHLEYDTFKPSLKPIVDQLVRDSGMDKNAGIDHFIRLYLEEPTSSLYQSWNGNNKLENTQDGFWDLNWQDRIIVLRNLVDHNLVHCDRVRDVIRSKAANSRSTTTMEDGETLMYLRPIGYDRNKFGYWIIDDNPRLYVSGNPYKKKSPWKCVAKERDQIKDLTEYWFDAEPLKKSQKSNTLVDGDPTRIFRKCTQVANFYGLSRYTLEERLLRCRIFEKVLPKLSKYQEQRDEVERKREQYFRKKMQTERRKADLEKFAVVRSARLRDRQSRPNYAVDNFDDGGGEDEQAYSDNATPTGNDHYNSTDDEQGHSSSSKRRRLSNEDVDEDYLDDPLEGNDSQVSSKTASFNKEEQKQQEKEQERNAAIAAGLRRSQRNSKSDIDESNDEGASLYSDQEGAFEIKDPENLDGDDKDNDNEDDFEVLSTASSSKSTNGAHYTPQSMLSENDMDESNNEDDNEVVIDKVVPKKAQGYRHSSSAKPQQPTPLSIEAS